MDWAFVFSSFEGRISRRTFWIAVAILTVLPAVNFSGLLTPVSSLSTVAKMIGLGFPSTFFQQISVGTFTKALGFRELFVDLLILVGFVVVYSFLSCRLLRKQEV